MYKSAPLFTVLALILFNSSLAQVGIGTESPNPKSVLDLRSPGNNQGFLAPRLTTEQRIAFAGLLADSDKGMLVFDTTTGKFYYWNGAAWVIIEDSTGTDNQTLAYTPSTGVLGITGGNTVNLTGTAPGGNAGGDLAGTYPNPSVANNAITSAKILDGTISATDLANNSVTDVKIANMAPSKITGGGATNGQVLKWNGSAWVPQTDDNSGGTLTNIATGTGLTGGPITTTGTISIAANGVSATELRSDAATDANRAVTTNHIRDNAVTSAKIADGSIVNADISTSAAIAVNKLVAGTNGQVLTTTGGVPVWGTSGTVTNVATGTGLAGGPITTTGTIALANTAVTPGSYGNATQVSSFTVDAQGRITSASNTTISGVAPGGAAGNDLSGTYPNPTVARIQGRAVATTVPSNGQVLKWNGSAWAPAADIVGGGVTGSATDLQLAIWNGTSSIGGSPSLVWEGKNNMLGIGIDPPIATLHVEGSQAVKYIVAPGGIYNVKQDDYVIFTIEETSEVLLPDADVNKGRVLIIRATGSKAVFVRAGNGKDLIDLQSNIQISQADQGSLYSITLISYGNGWLTLNKSRY